MEAKGWFRIPGRQQGERSLAEQLRGLDTALLEAEGRTVLDLGCAEGLIALEFARAGALVFGVEHNAALLDVAREIGAEQPLEVRSRLSWAQADIGDIVTGAWYGAEGWDIVLALAVLHKLQAPREALKYFAEHCRSLFVVRLPAGSTGAFATKHHGTPCDLSREMSRLGFLLERVERGPRRELVQYWRRRKR